MIVLTNRDLLRIHVEALFTRDAAGRLVRINEPRGARAPRFFLGRTDEGTDCWFRDDLAADVIQELEACAATGPSGMNIGPAEAAMFESILARRAPVGLTWSGPAFRFPRRVTAGRGTVWITPENENLLRPLLSDWLDGVEHCQPLCAVVVDEHVVAVCGSVRRSAVAHEAGVETAPAYRRRGYAAVVVDSWASAVAAEDRVPLYSTSWTNVASRALARRLGLVRFASDLYIA